MYLSEALVKTRWWRRRKVIPAGSSKTHTPLGSDLRGHQDQPQRPTARQLYLELQPQKHSVAELPEARPPEAREAELPAALVQHVCAVDAQLCMFPDIESMKLCLEPTSLQLALASCTDTRRARRRVTWRNSNA